MDKLEKFSVKGKHGYRNAKGEVVIEPQFDDGISTFGLDSYNHTEYAPVSMNGKCGMIHESGTVIIPFEYQEVRHLFDDYFAVRQELPEKQWSCGVIKSDGTIVVPFDFKKVIKVGHYFECFKEASSSRVYTHTLFDTNGNVFKYSWEKDPIVYNSNGEMIYEGAAIESKFDYLIVSKDDKFGVIDHDGNRIVEIEYEDVIVVSPDRIIVRRNNDDSWLFGVLDSKSNIIIDFIYKYITSKDGAFFDCFKESDSSLQDSRSHGERYEYRNKKQELWLNSVGKEVYQGKAEVLSEELLACDKDGKKAVFNYNGKRIVNFLYDRIRLLDNYLIVEKDFKVGVLTDSGNVVIDALYGEIEFVHIDDSVSPKYTDYGHQDGEVYGKFSKNNPFDTAAEKDRLNRQLFQFVKRRGILSYTGISCPREHYSFSDIMILRTDTYAELFSIEEGIIHNSRFDTIKQLTNLSYIVSKEDKYGVYRRDIHRLIIECEFERIIFEGDHVVLLFKDGLWGAKTLVLPEHPLYPLTKADVPIQFKEITILNSFENLFGVKHERTNYREETIEEYTIVDEEGKIYEKMDDFSELSTMPVLYDLNHVLTSRDEKYGFVSVKGYESVPFVYDEIIERDDSLFDVRIEESWGVIDLFGKVIVSVKYSNPVPSSFDNAIVSAALSERLGVLNADGREKVPTVYEHLMMEDKVIYCGYGGYENNSSDYSSNNFFSGDIEGASWGVLTKEGVPIIDPLYDCFKEQDGYILAGRDGGFLGEGQHGFSFRESEYGGVYDLFDYEGNLILGGFNKFHKDEAHNLLYFHFGGGWEQECEDYDKWGNAIYYYSYQWNEGNGRWLVTDLNLTSIIPKQDGSTFTFRKGAKCTITKKKEDGKTTNYWSFPLEQLSVLKPVLSKGCFIVGDDNRQKVIRLKDRASTRFYNTVRVIDKNTFYTFERKDCISGVGISTFIQEIISCDKGYSLLTKPVQDSVFAVQKIDDDNYSVLLLNTQNADSIITAIDKVNYWDLVELVGKGKLQLLIDKDSSDNKPLSVRDKSIFNDGFIAALNIEERDEPFDEKTQYWFSEDIHVSFGGDDDDDDYYDEGGDDDWDYERETWDAMTDGMYGDMPEGFDGDYSFMGR